MTSPSVTPEGKHAHRLVFSAVRRGSLVRQPCEVCGTARTDAHHPHGYDRPLDVAWLCRVHHFAEHGIVKKEALRRKRQLPLFLTDAQVEEVRARSAAGESQAALAREFRVHYSTISRIVNAQRRVDPFEEGPAA